MMIHAYNPSYTEKITGGRNRKEASHRYSRSYLKNIKRKKKD
jgi:hypothetical protein